jgi:hypothetical protein
MIISHKYKFIFIKTKKTAGTSIEIALSKYCGSEDIISTLGPDIESEKIRQELGYRGPQNYRIPLAKYKPYDLLRLARYRQPMQFNSHAGANYISKYIDRDIWDSYFKFCFERNPWEKVISLYHFMNRHKDNPPPLPEFIQSSQLKDVMCFHLYSNMADILVDRVFFI